jgi:hypothetical protein
LSVLTACGGRVTASEVARNQSVVPESLKPVRSKLRVSHSVLDVPMTEIVLDRAGVVSLIGELETAGVAQHVRVNGEAKPGLVASPSDDLPDRGIGHGRSTLGREDVWRDPVVAP